MSNITQDRGTNDHIVDNAQSQIEIVEDKQTERVDPDDQYKSKVVLAESVKRKRLKVSDGDHATVTDARAYSSSLTKENTHSTTELDEDNLTEGVDQGDQLHKSAEISGEDENPDDEKSTVTDARVDVSTVTREVYATTTVKKYAPYYYMKHKNRGKAYIFNHFAFNNCLDLPKRTGTYIDRDNLTSVLLDMGFDPIQREDLTVVEIQREIMALASMDHTDNDCVLVAVMTHGDYGFLYAKDTHYPTESLWEPFTADKCKTLAGKPKLFFIQSCQGFKMDHGVMLSRKFTQCDGSNKSSPETFKIPVYADFLIARSTIPGFYSWREPNFGSWFIQELCAELKKYGTRQDLLRLLTFVNQKVSMYETHYPSDLERHRKKQTPSINSMLTRLLVFQPKH